MTEGKDSLQHDTPDRKPTGHGKVGSSRCLRLSSILMSLGTQAQPQEPSIPRSKPGRLIRRRRPKVRSNITLGEIIDQTAHAGFGFLAAFLALVAIPFAGLGAPFGLAIGFLGVQMIARRNRPWLPKRLRRHVVTMKTLDWLSQRVTRWTAGMERFIKPRMTFLMGDPLFALVGAGLILQGIGLALPIPLPASNWVFIIPILIYGIGLLEDDGLLVLIGHIFTGSFIVLGIVFWELIQRGLVKAWAFVASLF